MATTDIMTGLRIAQVTFEIMWQQEHSIQGGGTPRTKDTGEALWKASLGSTPLSRDASRRVDALINALRGAINTFYVWDPIAQYPILDPTGLVLGASAVKVHTATTTTLRLKGLPAAYAISIGDKVSFATGSSPVRQNLHQFTQAGIADGSGITAALTVSPPLQVVAPTDTVVSLARPVAEMFILPGSKRLSFNQNGIGVLSFEALQV